MNFEIVRKLLLLPQTEMYNGESTGDCEKIFFKK